MNSIVIVDSSVWIDALGGVSTPQTVWLNRQLEHRPVGLTSLIYCEVLQGIRSEKEFLSTQRELSQFPIIENHTAELAVQAAAHYRYLRARGITVRKTVDCLIATLCIQQGWPLLHSDRDFNGFARHLGLQVIEAEARELH